MYKCMKLINMEFGMFITKRKLTLLARAARRTIWKREQPLAEGLVKFEDIKKDEVEEDMGGGV